jgi:ketosteroid isomerase-like protein
VFASGGVVAAETQADDTMLDGSEYHNRYAWLVELDGPTLRAVREYMDHGVHPEVHSGRDH